MSLKHSLAKRKKIYGRGVNDANYVVVRSQQVWCPFYRVWHSMLARTLSQKVKHKYPTYAETTVDESWLLFSNFRCWMIQQDWEGKDLDKDIIEPGNTHYSPEFCCFVDPYINRMLMHRSPPSDLPRGVSRSGSQFRAQSYEYGRAVYLGLHATPEAAHRKYNERRYDHLVTLAASQKDVRARMGLLKHAALLGVSVFKQHLKG